MFGRSKYEGRSAREIYGKPQTANQIVRKQIADSNKKGKGKGK